MEFTADASKFVSYTFKPQLRTLGPKYGKLLGKIRDALTKIADGQAAYKTLTSGEALIFDFDGQKVELYEADVLAEMSQVPGFVAQSEGSITVALDTNLTPELIEEGFVNELTSKLQTMRKEAGFEVTDHIQAYLAPNEKLSPIFTANAAQIKADILCDDIAETADETFYTKEWDINGVKATLAVKKL